MRSLLISTAALGLCLLDSAYGAIDDYLGAYGRPGEAMVIVTRWGDDLYLLDMTDGRARQLAPLEDGDFAYGPTRSSTEPVAGQVRFERDDAGDVTSLMSTGAAEPLPRIALELTDVELDNGEAAHLSGTLVSPPTRPRAWILYLSGEGPNPRRDSWDVAAWLAAHGIGSLIIDQRGAGLSTGEEVSGTYHARSMAAASDAVAAMRFLLGRPETTGLPVGVGGHSQGGWLGAIVARKVPETSFYVNLAGNGSPGWAQWRHAMTTWLHRQQVAPDQIARASAYFDAFFGIYHDETSWNDYTAAQAVARAEAWWPVMKQRYFAEWESIDEARSFASAEAVNVPADDFRQVESPALGLFFEHDHSTTPETPQVFLQALLAGGNGNVTVRVFPGADHGAWVVDGYRMDRSRITHRLTAPYELMRDWILEVVESSPR